METYTLKIKGGYSSTNYLLFHEDGTQLSDTEVNTLFASDGAAYFKFDFDGGSAPAVTNVKIVSTNSTTELAKFPTFYSGFVLNDTDIYKATWRGLATTYTYRQVDTFIRLGSTQAYGLTASQLTQLVNLAKAAPVVTLTTTDPGEGATLAANNFIGVYDA